MIHIKIQKNPFKICLYYYLGMNRLPFKATFTLVLSKLIEGQSPVIKNAKCEFTYHWDFDTNKGLAHLVSIDNCPVNNIALYPEGMAGRLAFMSDMKPTSFVINGQRIVIFRVILHIILKNNERMAAIMFNEDGSCIESTDNFQNEKLSS